MILLNCRDFTEAAASGKLDGANLWVRFSAWLHVKICPHCEKFIRQLRLITSSARIGIKEAAGNTQEFLARTVDFLARH